MPIPETNLTEVAEILISLYARQAAILKLLHKYGAGPNEIDEMIQKAEDRIRKLPVVQEVLSKRRLPPPGSLATALTGFPWNQ